jgi:hypothetical protein
MRLDYKPIGSDPEGYDLGWFAFIPRILRLCVYKFGIWGDSTFYERFFLNRFHNTAQGLGFFGCKQNYDNLRPQGMVEALKNLGGKEHFLVPKDGEAELQVIQLKCSDIHKKIKNLGGTWTKEGDKIVIRGPQAGSDDWSQFYTDVLKKIFKKEGRDDQGSFLITSESAESIPFNSWRRRKTDCAIFARLGKSFTMSKTEIAYFLGKGIDVCLYDTRGVLNSKGVPSEGGLNNDIEAVGEFLFQQQGHQPKKTCIYASCGESFTALHLFSKYHKEGINLFLQNAPASMGHVLGRINWIARRVFYSYQVYVQAPKGSESAKGLQDGFDSTAKIEALGKRNSGYVILAKTPGDDTAPCEEIDAMGEKLRFKGSSVTVLESKAEDSMARPGHTDPHLADPIRNPKIQPAIHKVLF